MDYNIEVGEICVSLTFLLIVLQSLPLVLHPSSRASF